MEYLDDHYLLLFQKNGNVCIIYCNNKNVHSCISFIILKDLRKRSKKLPLAFKVPNAGEEVPRRCRRSGAGRRRRRQGQGHAQAVVFMVVKAVHGGEGALRGTVAGVRLLLLLAGLWGAGPPTPC
ncbi:hypothetical protein NQ318_003599 [Aromia moschata]|uniref:Uncharacterized protein n=1 Tax=Aromia moschata TaxID=1265417 RepID=A0AAV8YVJ1_9CUCU|nr:hypothetical protein NQ318_003599 [Aromia moschata]